MSRTGLTFRNPTFERIGTGEQHHVGTLAPVYPETQGITSRFLRSKIEPLLGLVTQVPDRLPPSVRDAAGPDADRRRAVPGARPGQHRRRRLAPGNASHSRSCSCCRSPQSVLAGAVSAEPAL